MSAQPSKEETLALLRGQMAAIASGASPSGCAATMSGARTAQPEDACTHDASATRKSTPHASSGVEAEQDLHAHAVSSYVVPPRHKHAGSASEQRVGSCAQAAVSHGSDHKPNERDEFPENEEERVREAYAKILRCVSVREHSSVSMRKKLLRAGFEPGVVDQAMNKALHARVIDDVRYADSLLRVTIAQGKGTHALRQEFEALGIELDSLESYQDLCADDDQSEELRALLYLRSHPTRSKNKLQGAFRKLVSRGFSSQAASQAARTWAQEEGF